LHVTADSRSLVLLSQLPRSSSGAQGCPGSLWPFRSSSTGRWDRGRAVGLGYHRAAKQSSSPAKVPGQAGPISTSVLCTAQQHLMSSAKVPVASLPPLTKHGHLGAM